jgi:hypothetical protein
MKVWVLLAKSESGDDYGPWVFLTDLRFGERRILRLRG